MKKLFCIIFSIYLCLSIFNYNILATDDNKMRESIVTTNGSYSRPIQVEIYHTGLIYIAVANTFDNGGFVSGYPYGTIEVVKFNKNIIDILNIDIDKDCSFKIEEDETYITIIFNGDNYYPYNSNYPMVITLQVKEEYIKEVNKIFIGQTHPVVFYAPEFSLTAETYLKALEREINELNSQIELLEIKVSELEEKLAAIPKSGDLNADSKINILDAVILERYLANDGEITSLPYIKEE